MSDMSISSDDPQYEHPHPHPTTGPEATTESPQVTLSLRQALVSAGSWQGAKVAESKSYNTIVDVAVFPIESLPLQDLIQHATSHEEDALSSRDPSKAKQAKLWLGAEIGKGAFKTARRGHLQVADINNFAKAGWRDTILGIQQVVVKAVNPMKGKKRSPNAQASLCHLAMESKTHQWAMALLDETMWHVDRIIEEHGAPDFGIPSVRLVEAGVALPVGQNTAYLIEELINEQIKFVKYINNASSTCIKLSDPEEEVRGLFLSFAQHHQWLVTGRLAFVSDFQGGGGLLTDAQIISNPDLGPLFGGGNINSTFNNFAADHTCNYFCEYFIAGRKVQPRSLLDGEAIPEAEAYEDEVVEVKGQ